MRILQSILGIVAVLVFLAASAAMNAHFWLAQGKSDLEGQILAGVSVAGDLFKAMLPFFIAAALAQRSWLKALVGSGMFAIILAFSLMSALGFASGNRGAVTGPREAMSKRYEAVVAEISEIDTQISKVGDIPDIRVVEAAIARHKTDVRWRTSKLCEDPTADKSRDFCAEYFTMQSKLATAMSGKVLVDRKATLRSERDKLSAQGAEQAADPQASLLAKLLKAAGNSWADASTMQTVVLVLIAVMIELVAAFGLWLCAAGLVKETPATTGRFPQQRQRRPEPASEVVEASPFLTAPMPAASFQLVETVKKLQANRPLVTSTLLNEPPVAVAPETLSEPAIVPDTAPIATVDAVTPEPEIAAVNEPVIAPVAKPAKQKPTRSGQLTVVSKPAPVTPLRAKATAAAAPAGPERFRLEEAGALLRSPAG